MSQRAISMTVTIFTAGLLAACSAQTSNAASERAAATGDVLHALAGLSFSVSYELRKSVTVPIVGEEVFVTRMVGLGTLESVDDSSIALDLAPCSLTLPATSKLRASIPDAAVQELPRLRLAPVTMTDEGSIRIGGASLVTDSGSVTADGPAAFELDNQGNPSLSIGATALGAHVNIQVGLNLSTGFVAILNADGSMTGTSGAQQDFITVHASDLGVTAKVVEATLVPLLFANATPKLNLLPVAEATCAAAIAAAGTGE
jgi:hypothetical protein